MIDIELGTENQPEPGALAGRVILITGAGQGLGRAWAETAAAYGASVVLLDRSVPELEATYDAIEAADGPQPAIYPMDLLGASPEDHAALATCLTDEFGRLDGVVHNAASLGKPAPLSQYDVESWYRTMQINLNAAFLVTRYCLPLLQQAASPRLIGVSDAAGREGMPFYGAYGVSKWALEGLLQTLVAELPDNAGLRVASVDPGPVRTALRAEAYPVESPTELPNPSQLAASLTCLLDPAFDVTQGGRYVVRQAD